MKETQSPPLGFGGVDKKLPRNVPQRHLAAVWPGGCAMQSPPACAGEDAQSAGSEGPGHAGPFTAELPVSGSRPSTEGTCHYLLCGEREGRSKKAF